MSTRKPSRSKKVKPKAIIPKTANTDGKPKASFLLSLMRMLFLVVAVLACVLAIYNALNVKDVVNPYIKKNLPNLLRNEAILFGVIAVGFIYSSFKLFFRMAEKRFDYVILLLVFVAINLNFMVSFDKDIGSFGDNASYIINAKSLLEKGGPYKLDKVDQPYDYKAALGLPVMLTPIVAIWGMDVVKMKSLVFILGSLSMFFFFMAFKKRLGIYGAAILTILLGTYPMIIYNTSYVMTEVPFLFAMALTLYFALDLSAAKTLKKAMIYGVLTALAAIFLYMTRAVGIGAIVGIIAWLFVWIPWVKIFKKEAGLLNSLEIKKFALVSVILTVFVAGWQMRSLGSNVEVDEQGTEEVVKNKSQAGSFAERDLGDNYRRNYKLCEPLWAQQVFSKKLSRWYLSLGKAANIKKMDAGLRTFNTAIFILLIIGLLRRRLVAYLFLFIVLVTLTGSESDRGVIFSRYIIVLMPLLIYLFIDFFIEGFKWASGRFNVPVLQPLGSLSAIVFAFFMLSHNFSGAAFNNQRQNAGDTYTIAFDNYIKSAIWVKENIPGDVVVASRKPRLFYIFSEKRSIVTVYSNSQVYNKEIEDEVIQRMRDKGAKYLVLDGFSTASRKVILPLVQNNPQLFKAVESVGEKYPAYVIEFTDK